MRVVSINEAVCIAHKLLQSEIFIAKIKLLNEVNLISLTFKLRECFGYKVIIAQRESGIFFVLTNGVKRTKILKIELQIKV